jgi:hypothetical protein
VDMEDLRVFRRVIELVGGICSLNRVLHRLCLVVAGQQTLLST